jgi:23S rRNA (pseudouridine1915-N3)-methyltransferase
MPMLKIKVLAVGKLKERALCDLVGEYIKRLGRYCAPEVTELRDESIPADSGGMEILRRLSVESGRISGMLKQDSYVIALDIKGDAPDSEKFAENLRSLADRCPEIVFVIGGSHGLHPDMLKRADYVLSMSNMTFPHQLARLILLEQVYRAFKIINNETYHK